MRNLWSCRRTFISTLAILCLTGIAIAKGVDVSVAIATICAALGAANAYERVGMTKADSTMAVQYSTESVK